MQFTKNLFSSEFLFVLFVILLAFFFAEGGCGGNGGGTDSNSPNRSGWAIGSNQNNTAVILHTGNGGATWEEQGNTTKWSGLDSMDISAVDEETAWAALGDNNGTGMILHTSDGGAHWEAQELPQGVQATVKGIKGLSPSEAWAVTLHGTVMRITDGGRHWREVPLDGGVTIHDVNRMDAKGEDVWIADYGQGEDGMIHSPDSGQTWRSERLPSEHDSGPMAVSIVSSQIAWASAKPDHNIYRTSDGGDTWDLIAEHAAGNDIDDICAPRADMAWAVEYGGFGGGTIFRVNLVDGEGKTQFMQPNASYSYEGVTCFDNETAWVVGFKTIMAKEEFPHGIILHTEDGGTTWQRQEMPVDDVGLWKISFVGAHR